MKIRITQADIDMGTPCSGAHCPVALAVKRRLKTYDVSVLPNRTYAYKGGRDMRLKHDSATTQFIHDFDFKLPVKPFTAELWIEESR